MKRDEVVFHDLSRGLTQNERDELLKKIKTSLTIDNENSGLHQEEMDKDEKLAIIKKEKNEISLIRRFFLWLQSKLTGRSVEELMLSGKLMRIKRKIRKKDSGLTGFETRNLTPRFAELVYELYKAVVPVRNLFKKIWLDDNSLNTFFMDIVEEGIGERIQDIEDIVSFDAVISAFGKAGRKDDIKSLIVDKLFVYVDSINKNIFKELEIDLLPLYRLKNLVLFPYVNFFQQFGYTLLDTPYTENPHFKNASAVLCLEDLEKLYFAVYAASKLERRVNLNSKLMDRLAVISGNDPDESSSHIVTDLEFVIQKALWFYEKVPLADLIRYFKKNPFIKMIFYIPSVDLKEFYRTTLKMRLLNRLDERFEEIQKEYIVQEIENLFSGKHYVNFQNYREYSSIDYEKLGVSSFRNIKPLSLVYNFIECFYRGGVIQSIVRVLEKGVLSQNRLMRDNMLQYASTLEDVSDRIRIFDNSLSPDSEEGKVFHKLRFSISKDVSQQKIFRKIVIQKDREAKNLAEAGIDAIAGLKRVLGEINKSTNDSVIDQLKQHYLIDNKPVVLQDLLVDSIEKLNKTEHLYHHMLTHG